MLERLGARHAHRGTQPVAWEPAAAPSVPLDSSPSVHWARQLVRFALLAGLVPAAGEPLWLPALFAHLEGAHQQECSALYARLAQFPHMLVQSLAASVPAARIMGSLGAGVALSVPWGRGQQQGQSPAPSARQVHSQPLQG